MKFKNCKSIIAVFLVIALIGVPFYTGVLTVFADEGNLALNKQVYSGGDFNASFAASRAVDGLLTTHWASGSVGAYSGVAKNTIIVDLGEEYDIDTVNVRSERDMDRGGYSRSGWSVYISTDFNFENAVLVSERNTSVKYGEDLEIQLERAVCGRYVKVTSTTMVVLSDIEVYGELPKKGLNNSYSLKDYSDLEPDDAAQLVTYLGILEGISDKEFGTLALLKRKEAVKSVLALTNYKTISTENCFDDVDADDEFGPYICGALSLGIISNAKNFRPEDYITTTELYTMILRALGYGEYAAALGNYPIGSLMAASKIGLDKDAEIDGNEYVNRKSALNIMYNALMLSVMENSKISEDGSTLRYGKKNKTVLEKYFHMSLFSGIVTANNASTLNDTVESNPENIVIDNKVYRDLTYSAYSAIGRNICFVVDSDDENGIMTWWENIKENKIYEIDCGDLESVSKNSIKYYVNGTMQKKQFNITNADILKNTSACYDYAYNLDSFKQEDAYIVLIDNDSDGVIEVVNIMQPTVVPVDAIDFGGESVTIAGKDGKSISFENYDNVNVMINGAPGKKRLLNNSAVVYAYLTPNNKNVTLDGYTTVIEGETEAIGNDSVTIDGEEYEFSDYYKSNQNKMGNISVGAISKYTIGKDQKVVWVDDSHGLNSLEKLGFITRTDVDGNRKSVRIFNDNSEFVTLELADKVTVDGVTLKVNYISENPDVIAEKYAIYKLDSEQKIKWIDTENYDAASEPDSKMYKVEGVSPATCRSHANAVFDGFKMLFPTKSDMKVFFIPYSRGKIMTSAEYEKYYFTTVYSSTFSSAGILLNDNDAFYRQDENGFPLFASRSCRTSDDITTGDYAACAKYSPVMVVTKITKALNPDDDEAYSISGYDFRTGAQIKYSTSSALQKCINTSKIFADGVSEYINNSTNAIISTKINDRYLENIDDIKCGDILKYNLVNNTIIGLEKICERDLNSEYRFGDEVSFPHTSYRYLCGEVISIEEGLITYEAQNGIEVREYDKFRYCFVYENTNDGKGSVSLISPSKLPMYFRSGQRCIVYLNVGKAASIIVYE